MKFKIYRFEKNEPNRFECIKRGHIYLSSPEEFNDLDDCRIAEIVSRDYDDQHYQKLEKCIEILYEEDNPDFPLPKEIFELLREFFSHSKPDPKDSDQRMDSTLHQTMFYMKIRDYLRQTTGVCCFFQGEPSHSLMWAHYANGHTGFCIEYEVDDEFNIPLYEVNYSNKSPSPTIGELLFSPKENFLKILTSKSLDWSYEKEFRLVHLNEIKIGEKGKQVKLPDGLKPIKIITGKKFSEDSYKFFEGINLEKISYESFAGSRKLPL